MSPHIAEKKTALEPLWSFDYKEPFGLVIHLQIIVLDFRVTDFPYWLTNRP